MNVLRIIVQFFIIVILGSTSLVLLYFKIPGNDEVCDSGQGYYVIIWTMFYIACVFFILNSWIFYEKGSWKKIRLYAIRFTFLIIFLSFSLKGILLTTIYGSKKYTITEKIGNGFTSFLKLKLYKNGKFFCYTYDTSCEQETFGKYSIVNDTVTLKFKSEKSHYLGTKLVINDRNAICMDCSYDINLIIEYN